MPATQIQKILDSYADVPLYQFSLRTSVANTPVFALINAQGGVVGSVCASVSAILASGGVEISLLSYYRQIIGDTTGASGFPSDAVGFIIGRANGVQIGTNGRRDATVATGNVSGQMYSGGYLGLGTGYYVVPRKKSFHPDLPQTLNFTYTTWANSTVVAAFYDRFGSQVAKGATVACASGTTYDIYDLGGVGYSGFMLYTNQTVVYFDWSGDKSAAAGGELRLPAGATFITGSAPSVSTN